MTAVIAPTNIGAFVTATMSGTPAVRPYALRIARAVFGIHAGEDGALRGDVRFDEAAEIVKALTPVPGGVGPVTTAVLARHVIEAAERNAM